MRSHSLTWYGMRLSNQKQRRRPCAPHVGSVSSGSMSRKRHRHRPRCWCLSKMLKASVYFSRSAAVSPSPSPKSPGSMESWSYMVILFETCNKKQQMFLAAAGCYSLVSSSQHYCRELGIGRRLSCLGMGDSQGLCWCTSREFQENQQCKEQYWVPKKRKCMGIKQKVIITSFVHSSFPYSSYVKKIPFLMSILLYFSMWLFPESAWTQQP